MRPGTLVRSIFSFYPSGLILRDHIDDHGESYLVLFSDGGVYDVLGWEIEEVEEVTQT